MRRADTDYLIIGAGTTGLAFADTLIAETDAHVTLVDRHGKPGGHWNDAYPFVTLHQPSSFYGVVSMELGSGLKDPVGLNRGMAELASGPEVSGYFDRVMNHRLLASGRVQVDGAVVCDGLCEVSQFSRIGVDSELLQAGKAARYFMLHKPIGVADYELTRALPAALASSLPSIETLEAELSGDLENEAQP